MGVFPQLDPRVDSASEQGRPTAVSVSCARRSHTTPLLSGQNPEVQLGDEKSSCNSREKANTGWRDVEAGLKNEIMLRHYSPKTFKSYCILQANYDIRQIQQMLGHSDVRTTMIYTHCIVSDVKPLKSPLDL